MFRKNICWRLADVFVDAETFHYRNCREPPW